MPGDFHGQFAEGSPSTRRGFLLSVLLLLGVAREIPCVRRQAEEKADVE